MPHRFSQIFIEKRAMASLTNILLEHNSKFNGRNYGTWKQRIIAIFEYRNTDQLVLGVKQRPTSPGPDQDTWDLNNREAVMLLKLSVADDQLSQIPSGKTAAEIWTHLKGLHETSDKSRAFFLKNTLFSIVMDERTSLQAHLNRIQEIRDQLLAIGRKMEEEDIVVITLRSLPNSYEHFIETLNITSTGVDLKFTDLCTLLLQQDRWKQQFGSSSSSTSTEQAFAAKSFQKDKGKFQQPSQQKSSAPASNGTKKKNIQCNYCHKYGHMKVACRKRLAAQSKQSGSQPKANSAEHTEQVESAFYAFMAKRPADHVQSSAWYIDSGASRHFTHRKDWFTDYQPYSDSVIFGGGEEYTVVGKSNIQIQSVGRKLIFLDVYYVPAMELNLLSVSQLLRHSPHLAVTFSLHQCTITDRATKSTVAVGLEDHGLFRLTDSGDSQDLAMAAR